jgi:excisionase family DNA binding protein
MLQKLLRISEVAVILDVPEGRAYQLAREAIIPIVRVGRQVRVDATKLAAWINGGGQGHQAFHPVDSSPGRHRRKGGCP